MVKVFKINSKQGIISGLCGCFGFWAGTCGAENRAEVPVHELSGLAIAGWRVAVPEAGATFATPVSGLVYEPFVDVQARNFAESQADVTIRGGVFENTGFALGAGTLFDPQTGHYFAEMPVPPAMLGAPQVLTGVDNARAGFNSAVGTIRYPWKAVGNGGFVEGAVGENGLNRQEVFLGQTFAAGGEGSVLGVQISGARSESDGALAYGDHQFERAAARLQWRTATAQSDFFVGYQEKFFGWPNLYAPASLHQALSAFGASGTGAETENLQSTLLLLNHRQSTADGLLEITAYFRKNRDDYEFDRFVPGLFNPYQHQTEVFSVALQGERQWGTTRVRFGGQLLADTISSTSLTWVRPAVFPEGREAEDFAPFMSRSYGQAAVDIGQTHFVGEGAFAWVLGMQTAMSNRDEEALHPYARASYDSGNWNFFVEYAENSQLPGYTALASNPNSGLFRGNPFLGRESSRQIELGSAWQHRSWETQAAFFFRQDDDLVDWVFSLSNPTARTAREIDTDTSGFEALISWRGSAFEALLGYTFLDKSFDFADPSVEASFYALNYAEHRLTAALIFKPFAGALLRMDNEWRQQRENSLRTGASSVLLSALTVEYTPPARPAWTLAASAHNLWDQAFEEVPGVPGAPRSVLFSLRYQWD